MTKYILKGKHEWRAIRKVVKLKGTTKTSAFSVSMFLMEQLHKPKNQFGESCLQHPNTQGQILFQTWKIILEPPSAIFDSEVTTVLQVGVTFQMLSRSFIIDSVQDK